MKHRETLGTKKHSSNTTAKRDIRQNVYDFLFYPWFIICLTCFQVYYSSETIVFCLVFFSIQKLMSNRKSAKVRLRENETESCGK